MAYTKDNTTRYRIRITLSSGRTVYVADWLRTWDGSWFTTTEPHQIKLFQSRRRAERWIAARREIAQFYRAEVEEAGSGRDEFQTGENHS